MLHPFSTKITTAASVASLIQIYNNCIETNSYTTMNFESL